MLSTQTDEVNRHIAYTSVVQGALTFGLTRGDLDRLISLARMDPATTSAGSAIADFIDPGHLFHSESVWRTVGSIRVGVQRLDAEYGEDRYVTTYA